ncbi:MAG: hypothetical protein D6765_16345 [Bacteroidetes bacterium]|nr:MAG: hypothetical protein D6765_16345 [Bacteroidota bacterium]
MKSNKSILNLFIVGVGLLLALSSCGPALYVPNSINAPLLAEKGDYRIAGAYFPRYLRWNMDIQGATAVSDHALLTGSLLTNTGVFNSRNHIVFLEMGGGWYGAGKSDRHGNPWLRAEILGNFGLGTGLNCKNSKCSNRYKGGYQRLSFQPGIGVRSRYVEFSLHGRLSQVFYSGFRHYENDRLVERKKFNFSTFEPVVSLAAGADPVKFFIQFNSLRVLKNREGYALVTSDILELSRVSGTAYFTFGVVVRPKELSTFGQ